MRKLAKSVSSGVQSVSAGSKSVAKGVVSFVDQDGDGKVNLRDAFSFIDRDGDGSIGISEIFSRDQNAVHSPLARPVLRRENAPV